MIGRFEKFTFAISELSRYWHKIASDEMTAYGLKGPYAVYLVTMQRHPDGITAARLCELCEKNKADVSRAMADLEDKGMICRKTDGGNLYRALLVLTDKGKEAATHIKALAEKTLAARGCTAPVTVTLTDEKYPERTYGDLHFPAGTYHSLRILIGEGEGKNWWCVLFPPLCVGSASEETVLPEVEEDPPAGFTDSQWGLVSQDGKYEIRFKILELLYGR